MEMEAQMLRAYINYPNPHIETHGNSGCATIQQHQKQGQRVVNLELTSLSLELQRFATKAYPFAANRELNDMWINVDFADAAFERAVVEYVRTLLSMHYMPFVGLRVQQHCHT